MWREIIQLQVGSHLSNLALSIMLHAGAGDPDQISGLSIIRSVQLKIVFPLTRSYSVKLKRYESYMYRNNVRTQPQT